MPEYKLVTLAEPLGRGYLRGKLEERTRPVVATIVHTTGSGPSRRATEARFEAWRRKHGVLEGDAMAAAIGIYGHVMDASGHYLVDQSGEVVQVVPESHVAWHVGGAGSTVYARSAWSKPKRYAWWRDRWPGLVSPRDLAGGELWAGGSCNANTLAAEVVPDVDDPRRPWTDACWRALAGLVLDISQRHGIPLERPRILTHSDAHPAKRTTAGGDPWDPAPSQWSWDRMAGELARAQGRQPICTDRAELAP